MRWDNTVRYNLGMRAQSQDSNDPRQPELRRRRPQFQQRLARHQPLRRAVRVRLRLQAEDGLSRERGGLVRLRVQQPRQHQHRDGQHAGQRAARRRRAEPLHQALRQGRVGRIPRRVRVRQLRRGRRAGQRQGRPAHRVLGRQPAAWRRDPRRLVRAEPARRLEGLRDPGKRGEGAVPAARRHHAAGAADQGAVGGRPVVLQLAGRPDSRIGQLPDDPGPAQLRRRLVHLRTQSARRGDSGRAGLPAPVARRRTSSRRPTPAASATGAFRRAGARSGSTARWASTIAMRPTSFRRRWRRRA